MVKCKVAECDREVGRNGRKGFCQGCYYVSSQEQDELKDSVSNLFHTPPDSLNQSIIPPNIQFVIRLLQRKVIM